MSKKRKENRISFGPFGYLEGVSRAYRIASGLPLKAISDKPATEAQTQHRKKFAVVAAAVAHLRMLLNVIHQYKQPDHDPVGQLSKVIHQGIVYGEYPDYAVNYSKVQLLGRTRAAVHDFHLTISNAGVVGLSWMEDPYYKESLFFSSDAEVAVLMINENTHQRHFFENLPYPAGSKRLSFNILSYTPGDVLHCWMVLVAKNTREVSSAEYCGV